MGRSRAATPAGRSRSSARKPKRASKRASGRPASRTKPAGNGSPAKRVAASKAAPKRVSRSASRAKPRTARPKLLAGLRRSSKAKRRRRSASSWRYRLGLAAVLAVALGGGYLFWLRDSSLVAIDNVDVVGVTSGDREEIVAELTRVGESMTTLNLDRDRVEQVAGAFPTVESVRLDPNLPHGLRIEVDERPPTSLVSTGEREVAVAGDGTLLEGVSVAEDDELPVIEVDEVPAAGTLEGEPLEQALVAGAAPEPLRPLIESVEHSDDEGVRVTLRGEIPVRFGSAERAEEKWSAAAAVLADPKLDALTYLDVRVPERPAVGGAAIASASNPPA